MTTTMIDIYEAMGGIVNEERNEVVLNSGKSKPFDIILKVIPTGTESSSDGDFVTFDILLDSKTVIEGEGMNAWAREIAYGETIRLPVELVNIVKEDKK